MVSITAGSSSVDAVTLVPTFEVTFTIATTLPNNGQIVLTIPSQWAFPSIGNGDVVLTGQTGAAGTVTVSPSSNVLTITRAGDGGGFTPGVTTVRINNSKVQSSPESGTLAELTLETQDSGSTSIDPASDAINGPTVNGKSMHHISCMPPVFVLLLLYVFHLLLAVCVSLAKVHTVSITNGAGNINPITLVATTFQVTFSIATTLPNDGKIVLTLPSLWTLPSLANGEVILTGQTGAAGTVTLGVASNVLTIARAADGGAFTDGVTTVTMSAGEVMSSPVSGSLTELVVETQDVGAVGIDSVSAAIAGPTVLGTNSLCCAYA